MSKSKPGSAPSPSMHLARSVGLGLLAVIAGMGIIWLSTMADTLPAQTFWSNVGTAILTTGIVSFVYDALLQRSLLDQIRNTIGQAQSVVATGLERVATQPSEVDLHALLRGAKRIEVVPDKPIDWETRYFDLVLAAAEQGCDVIVHLPEPKPYAQFLASDRGRELATTEEACERLAPSIREAWERASHRISPTSTLHVRQYHGIPHTGLIVTDSYILVTSTNASGPNRGCVPLQIVFRPRQGSEIIEWAKSSITGLGSATIEGSGIPTVQHERVDLETILPSSEALGERGDPSREG
jgi:hypothetical protein